jgi:hypothetical protein
MQLLVPEFSSVYSGGAQEDIEYQVLIVVHIHTYSSHNSSPYGKVQSSNNESRKCSIEVSHKK